MNVAADLSERLVAEADDLHSHGFVENRDLVNLLREAAAAIALMRGQSWQPIETAPKDGSCILAWWPHWRSRAVIAYWSTQDCWASIDALTWDIPPTHWMPLPNPPTDLHNIEGGAK